MSRNYQTALLLALISLPSAAQVDHSSLNGTVTDAAGAVVSGAKVEAVSQSTGFRRSALTGDAGTYEIPALPIGVYFVTFAKVGFRPAEIKEVELTVGQSRTLDACLTAGAVAETVEVTATLDANRTSAEVGGLIDANYTFDGIDNNGVQEQTQNAETRLNIALDSIAEFRVSTAVYTASGAAGGVQVNVVSKTERTSITAAHSTRCGMTRLTPALRLTVRPSRRSRCISSAPTSAVRSKRTKLSSSPTTKACARIWE